MGALKDKVILITGASRGIGKAIALRAAQDGAKIGVVAKTAEPHPKLPGTIHTAAEEIRQAGGEALPLLCDIRFEDQVTAAVEKTVSEFGGIDVLINNASAISLTGTLETDMKRFDLMHAVNGRGTFLTTRACLPHLKASENPHVLNNAPPLNMKPHWFQGHVAYTMAKYGMSMCVLGMAEEFRSDGVAFNALWPRTSIATAAIEMLLGPEGVKQSRKPEIMADAAYAVITRNARSCTGNFFLDDEVLKEEGITDLSSYAVDSSQPLVPDFFLDPVPQNA